MGARDTGILEKVNATRMIGPIRATAPLPHPKEPSDVSTLLPTAGTVDCPNTGC